VAGRGKRIGRYHNAGPGGTVSSHGRVIRHQPAVARRAGQSPLSRSPYDFRDMPDRFRSRALLAVLLLLVTIAGIRAAAPPARVDVAARPVLIGTACALETVLAVLLIALRWRRARSGGSESPPGPAARLRGLLSGTIVTCLIIVPLAVLIAISANLRRRRPFRPPTRVAPRNARPVPPHRLRPGHGASIGPDIRYLLVALLAAAIIIAVIVIWRRGRGLAGAGRLTEPPEDASTPAELARAVDSGRVALRELDDARSAIIRCYLAMEASLAEAGAARNAAETPDELLGRAVAAGLVDGVPAGALTALFYEARFSTHPMPMSRRDEAEQALADIAAALPPAAAPRALPAASPAALSPTAISPGE
jgi:hypothetical protein